VKSSRSILVSPTRTRFFTALCANLLALCLIPDIVRADEANSNQPPTNDPDIEIFAKGLQWARTYQTADGTPDDSPLFIKAENRHQQRLELRDGKPWASKRGRLVRGYVSDVDGSVQPYGLVIPKGYDPAKPIRLDVVLHGSVRPRGDSELKFLERLDDGDTDSQDILDQPYIELHPLGRVENCYRWAGETDVFEAIEDVCRKYNIDRDRIVLRGMSMGASGTWHLGLKHPDRFVALGPYCGYVDTHRFSETPLDTFVRVGPLPTHQEATLHMLDSVDYAANAGVVPAIACMGEKDVFFQAHVIMGEAFRREGLEMVNLISPGTGHVIDPVTHAEQMRRIGEYAARGLNHLPRELRFVTWTLKYPRCHWVTLERLNRHYDRAEFAARVQADGAIDVDEPKNVTRFSIAGAVLDGKKPRVRIGGQEFLLPDLPAAGQARRAVVFVKGAEGWKVASTADQQNVAGKRPGLTGPIDDAFATKFLCLRGTGAPWNSRAQEYADASLRRFAYEWHRYFRGDLPIKDDRDVTADDARTSHLILFGDPGSNSYLGKIAARLPVRWTKNDVVVAGKSYAAAEHVPAFICPNPDSTERYVVVNSGHTFREVELAKLNYLLFPRWGDWAVIKVVEKLPQQGAEPFTDNVLHAGFFNEDWRF
jgi:pimeloyl-ACP methyl ester carboxylesterase